MYKRTSRPLWKPNTGQKSYATQTTPLITTKILKFIIMYTMFFMHTFTLFSIIWILLFVYCFSIVACYKKKQVFNRTNAFYHSTLGVQPEIGVSIQYLNRINEQLTGNTKMKKLIWNLHTHTHENIKTSKYYIIFGIDQNKKEGSKP